MARLVGQQKGYLRLLIAAVCLAGGIALALHHPLWPMASLALFCLVSVVAALRPGLWLTFAPSGLPFLNFAPWTGWLIFDEFDILLLATLAGSYAHWGWNSPSRLCTPLHWPKRTCTYGWVHDLWSPRLFFLTVCVLGLGRGFLDAGGFHFDWFAGYADAPNSLRIFKPVAWSFLLVPLLRQTIAESPSRAQQRLAIGIVLGLAIVTLAVVYERAAYPGLLDFSQSYRTVALFWEMHVGGAAIDTYLVLTAPFAAWAVLSARRPLYWGLAAALAVLSVYAWLTTFSRGVYLATALPLVFLGLRLRVLHGQHASAASVPVSWHGGAWRGKAHAILLLVLLSEIAAVLVGGSFMRHRVASVDQDWGSRLHHWQQGVQLLHGPADWLLGKGLGRFPAQYGQHAVQDGFSGAVQWRDEPGPELQTFVTLRGPATRQELAGLFLLTQQVGIVSPGAHRVALKVRVQWPIELRVALCEKHLLYDGDCQRGSIQVRPGNVNWQTLNVPLVGPSLGGSPWYAPRTGELSLSLASAGGAADLTQIQLKGLYGERKLENPDFSNGMSHWFYGAKSYFLPWHIDNLFLEMLIEQGLVGLLLFGALFLTALHCLLVGPARLQSLSPYIAASLFATLLLGMVSSVMDVPRVALLLWLMLQFAFESDVHARKESVAP